MSLPGHYIVAVVHTIGSTIDVTSSFQPSYLLKNFDQSLVEGTIKKVVSPKALAVLFSTTWATTKTTYRQLKGY